MKTCPVPGCRRSIAAEHLMCPSHWTRVPSWLQFKVHRTWRAYRDRRPGSQRPYVEARAEAIRSATPIGQCRTDLRALEAAL